MEDNYSSRTVSAMWHPIPHYYGDYVRSLFIAMAVLSFVATPLWGNLIPIGTIPQVGAALLLVLLAGLTSPRNIWLMLANATISAVSILFLESFAIKLHNSDSAQLFLAREAGVLLMLASLYFSVKTVRAMLSGKLGQADSVIEFEEPDRSSLVAARTYSSDD